MPSRKERTVASSYSVVKDVLSQRPDIRCQYTTNTIKADKRRKQRLTKAPTGHFSGLSRQRSILVQNLLRRRSIDDIPLQPLSLHRSLHPTTSFTPHLQLHSLRRIDEDTISPVTHPKWNVLVSLLGRSSSICVPEGNRLADFIQGAKTFT